MEKRDYFYLQANAIWIVRYYSNSSYCNKKKGERVGLKHRKKMCDVKLETEVQKLKKTINYHFIMHHFLLGTLMRNLFFHIVQNELIQILDSVCLLKMMQLCCCHIS